MSSRIFLRADCNNQIGLGHVYRCLSIAEMLNTNYTCHFLIQDPEPNIKKLISPFAEVVELPSGISLKEEIMMLSQYVTSSDILIIDSYVIDSNYQSEAKQRVKKLVSIDDEANIHFYADIVINHASPTMVTHYSKESYTKVMAGPKYLIARESFRKMAARERSVNEITSLFICMGGADPFNITCKVLNAAKKTFFKHIVVLTGSVYQHAEVLQASCKSDRVTWKMNLSADEMINEIKKCELAVSTASSISLEICCVKAGLLIGTVADNQQNIHQCLVDNGCAHSVGDLRVATEEEIIWHLNNLCNTHIVNNQMVQQHLLIDGESGTRILEIFNSLASE